MAWTGKDLWLILIVSLRSPGTAWRRSQIHRFGVVRYFFDQLLLHTYTNCKQSHFRWTSRAFSSCFVYYLVSEDVWPHYHHIALWILAKSCVALSCQRWWPGVIEFEIVGGLANRPSLCKTSYMCMIVWAVLWIRGIGRWFEWPEAHS